MLNEISPLKCLELKAKTDDLGEGSGKRTGEKGFGEKVLIKQIRDVGNAGRSPEKRLSAA